MLEVKGSITFLLLVVRWYKVNGLRGFDCMLVSGAIAQMVKVRCKDLGCGKSF